MIGHSACTILPLTACPQFDLASRKTRERCESRLEQYVHHCFAHTQLLWGVPNGFPCQERLAWRKETAGTRACIVLRHAQFPNSLRQMQKTLRQYHYRIHRPSY